MTSTLLESRTGVGDCFATLAMTSTLLESWIGGGDCFAALAITSTLLDFAMGVKTNPIKLTVIARREATKQSQGVA